MLNNKLNKTNNLIYHSLVASQAWVSFCLALWVWFFTIINQWWMPHMIWLSFFSTLLAYNFAYWIEERKAHGRLVVMVVAAIFSTYYFFHLQQRSTQLLLILMGLLSILYSLPYKRFNLRKIPKLKIFWIALIWACTILLLYTEHNQWNLHALWAVMSAFFFVIGITIPFDLRDLYTDALDLKTIPQQYGIARSKTIAMVSLFFSLGFFYLANHLNINVAWYAFGSSIIIGILLILWHKKTNSKWYTAFWIEGVSALPFIIFKILSFIIS